MPARSVRGALRVVMNSWIEGAGYLAAVAGTFAFVPQAWRTIRTGETRSISIVTATIFWISILLWTFYGWGVGSMPLLLCNAVALLPNSIILFMKTRNVLFSGEG